MDIYTASGEKVVFIGKNGWPSEAASAMEILTVGQTYTVNSLNVGQSSSTVCLEEVVGKPRYFNTVMFQNVGPTWKREDWFGFNYMGMETSQEELDAMPFFPCDMYNPECLPDAEVAIWVGGTTDQEHGKMVGTITIHPTDGLTEEHLDNIRQLALNEGIILHPAFEVARDPGRNIIRVTYTTPRNVLFTMTRHGNNPLSVLNPNSEEEAAALYMGTYGEEPTTTQVLYFGHSFKPSIIVE